AGLQLAAPLTRRSRADQVDRATDGIAPIQGALGAPQYLYPLYIPQVEQGAEPVADIHAINVQAHGSFETGIAGKVVADAADGQSYTGARALLDMQVGHVVRKTVGVRDALDFQRLGVER